LNKEIYCHGKLYVALSRVTKIEGLKLLVDDNECPSKDSKKNIVYKEIF
jgi:ATP-dependent DNA helicase PIF1